MIISKYNQLQNSRNYFQGGDHRVLTVCSAGLLRSPTMANVLHREFGYNTRSCGTYEDFALNPISTALLYWAKEVVFADQGHQEASQADQREQGKTGLGKVVIARFILVIARSVATKQSPDCRVGLWPPRNDSGAARAQ